MKTKKKRLTDIEKIGLASTYRNNHKVWSAGEGLDRFTKKQLLYIANKSTLLFNEPIVIDTDLFIDLWKRVQELQQRK